VLTCSNLNHPNQPGEVPLEHHSKCKFPSEVEVVESPALLAEVYYLMQ
jgi:hypothetical protein